MDFCADDLNRRSFLARAALGAILASASPIPIAGRQQAAAPAPPDPTDHAMFVESSGFKWERMAPEAGEWSPEIVILHVAPKTKATELMIRVPPGQHVPPHWHSANETHTIVSGALVPGVQRPESRTRSRRLQLHACANGPPGVDEAGFRHGRLHHGGRRLGRQLPDAAEVRQAGEVIAVVSDS